MLATEHVQKLKRWHSYKANVIISCLEIVFWGAVAFLVFQGNLSRCEGVTCYLSWVVVGIAVVIKYVFLLSHSLIVAMLTSSSHLEIYTSAIAIREFRDHRKTPLSSVMSGATDEEEMVQRHPAHPENVYHGHREHRLPAPPRHHTQIVRGKQ